MHIPPLGRSSLDRDHAGRALPDAIESALRDPETRILLLAGDRAPIADGRVVLVAPDAVPADAAPEPGTTLTWLGRELDARGSTGGVVLSMPIADEVPVAGAQWRSLRAVGAELDDASAGMMTQAVALARWQTSSARSPLDGSPMTLDAGGWVRMDTAGESHFPRTDPAVIVAIHDERDERILLGHNAAWPEHRYSLFAGFVDLGESLESAVVREVREETGLDVADVRYVGSQPWPFPRSLMIGFECVAASPHATNPDGVEILDVRWCTREELRSGVVDLPGPASIAAWMIERWIARGRER